MWMTEPPPRSPYCLSRLRCDQLLNGELEDHEELKQHSTSCRRCSELLAVHRRERASFSLALPRPRRQHRWLAVVALPAAALALCLLIVSRDRPERPDAADTRSKGKPALAFYLKRGGVVHRGGTGDIVFPHDAINFTASTTRPAFLAIISVDGAGHASVYYPDGATTAPLGVGQDQVLPLSVVLDDVLGFERVVGVFCDQMLPVAELEAVVVRGVELPRGCVGDALTIEKRSGP